VVVVVVVMMTMEEHAHDFGKGRKESGYTRDRKRPEVVVSAKTGMRALFSDSSMRYIQFLLSVRDRTNNNKKS